MPDFVAPGLEMIADAGTVHAVSFGGDCQLDEFARCELLGRRFVSEFEFSHPVVFTLPPKLSGMAPALTAVTPAVYLDPGAAVNWLLVRDEAGVMLIDAGYPGDRDDVLASLRQLGYAAGDVRAILLTHAHIDHLGSAIWFAKTHGTPVYCHPDEVGHAKRECLERASFLDAALRIWRPRWARWATHVVRNGGLTRAGIPTAQPLTAEVAAGLPGRPLAIPTPGHTSGHCSYLVEHVLASGDALFTGHPLLARNGPQLLPAVFSRRPGDCIRSLAALAHLDHEILAPGHGDLWCGPIREAVEQATTLARGWPSAVRVESDARSSQRRSDDGRMDR
jgi:glyoxylase-like metal-dependent hydrolase (beta-lactamase superfamily II)